MDTIPMHEAAERLGVPPSVVLADVIRGTKPVGNLPHLTGQRTADGCEVAAWELEGDRLKMHRERFGQCS